MNAGPGTAREWLQPRSLAMLALGFASGLPNTVVTETAGLWLAALKAPPATLGFLGAVGGIYSFKFLWAPLVDARAVPGAAFLGRRRSWLLAAQLACMAGIAAMALAGPEDADSSLRPMAAALLATAFVSATLDVVVNAWTVDAFPRKALGIGSAMSVTGYRMAMLAAGAAAPFVAVHAGWRAATAAMALFLLPSLAAALLSREPPGSPPPRRGLRESLAEPALELWRRIARGAGGGAGSDAAAAPEARRRVIAGLAFVALFRLPDQLAAAMQKSLILTTLQYSPDQYAVLRNGVGLAATLAGAALGGAAVLRLGRGRALLLAGILQALSNGGFMLLAQLPHGDGVARPWSSMDMVSLGAVATVENLCGGLVATVFVAYLMSLCSHAWSAAQYAILTGVMAAAGAIASAASGPLAERLGWTVFYGLTIAASVPGLLLIPAAAALVAPSSQPRAEE